MCTAGRRAWSLRVWAGAGQAAGLALVRSVQDNRWSPDCLMFPNGWCWPPIAAAATG
jgi:hypothetical protein